MNPFSNIRGMTLIEVVLAASLILTVVYASTVFYPQIHSNIEITHTRYTAINLAAAEIEDLKRRGRKDFNDANLNVGTNQPCTLDATSLPAGFNAADIDYDVENGTDWEHDNPPGPAGDTDYKKITARCRYGTLKDKEASLIGFVAESG